jgi:hypothetical protein
MDGMTERQSLELLWRERVTRARKRYQCASAKRAQIAEAIPQNAEDRGAGESEALAEYAITLGAFADLVLRGRRP